MSAETSTASAAAVPAPAERLRRLLLPSFVVRLQEAVDDRLSPILVKELRQALRAKVVMAAQLVTLGVMLVIMGIGLLAQDPGREEGGGFAVAIQCVLMIVCAGLVPLYTGVRLALERHDTGRDLLYVTTLSPRGIVLGKWVSGLCLGVLCFFGVLPFFVLCAFLPGVDLRGVLVCVGLDMAALLAGTALAVFMGALSQGWILRLLLGFVYLFLAGCAVAAGTAVGYAVMVSGDLGDRDIRQGLPFAVLLGLWLGGLMLTLAMASIAPDASNRARGPRLYLLWSLVPAALAVGGACWMDLLTDDHLLTFMVSCGILFSFAALMAISEPDTLGARIRRHLPSGWFGRVRAFILCSGAAQGLLFTILMWLLLAAFTAVAIWLLGGHNLSGSEQRLAWGALAMPAVVLVYGLLGNLVRRWLFPRTRPMVGAMIGVGLGVAGSAVPPVLAALLSPGRMQDHQVMMLALNPLGLMIVDGGSDFDTLALAWLAGVPAALLVLAGVQAGWLARQWREFAPWAEECCSHCGYDLRGSLGQARCPECGAPISPEAQAAARRLAEAG